MIDRLHICGKRKKLAIVSCCRQLSKTPSNTQFPVLKISKLIIFVMFNKFNSQYLVLTFGMSKIRKSHFRNAS